MTDLLWRCSTCGFEKIGPASEVLADCPRCHTGTVHRVERPLRPTDYLYEESQCKAGR